MSPTRRKLDIDVTQDRLNALGLSHAGVTLGQVLTNAVSEEALTHAFLDKLLSVELGRREERRIRASLKLSNLPADQTLENFDFTFHPAIGRSRIDILATGAWIRSTEAVLLLGPCMTRFYPRDQEVIHSGWGREIVDKRSGGRVNRSRVPTRFRPPARVRTGERGAEVKRSPRRRVGPLTPWLCRAVRKLGRPAFLDVPGVLNGCMGLNRIIARRGARDDG